MTKEENAVTYFRNHFNCSQAVFTVFGKESGISEDNCLKAACGFGGGFGRQQFICGALSGAVMAIGLRCGKGIGDPEEKKSITYAKTRELFEQFRLKHGSVMCIELLQGLNMNVPDDYKKIQDLHLFEKACEKYVADAVSITTEIITE